MTTYELIKLMGKLRGREEDVEKAGVIDKLAEYEGDLRIFVFTLGKDYFGNSAKVLVRMGYPKVKPVIYEMLQWYQDTNWPGAKEIDEFMRSQVPKDVLAQNVDRALKEAYKTNDTEWVYFLSVLVERADIADMINEEIVYDE